MSDEEAVFLRAVELDRKGFSEEAIALYESISTENPLVFGPIGTIYHFGSGNVSRDLDLAIECYQKAINEKVTPAISRSLIAAYYEKKFKNLDAAEVFLEKIAESHDPVSQLASLWLFALRFRDDRSPAEQREGREYGEKAARMGNVHARKAMAEVSIKEGRVFTGVVRFLGACLSRFWLGLTNKDDIRLQKY